MINEPNLFTKDGNCYSHKPTISLLGEDFEEVEQGLFISDLTKRLFPDELGELAVLERSKPKPTLPEPEPAIGFLDEAASAMRNRAALRDTPQGERTAGKIAKVFNAITGKDLTESDAWLFLLVLKIVRSRSGKYSRDDFVDMAAYSALLGEHESTVPK